MDGNDIRLMYQGLGLLQSDAAALIGVDIRTLRRWDTGEAPIPEPARRLLRLMERSPQVLQMLRELAEVGRGR
jgi:DNA-binding transcriptional regulator YiaG